jgi:hypothetical protein
LGGGGGGMLAGGARGGAAARLQLPTGGPHCARTHVRFHRSRSLQSPGGAAGVGTRPGSPSPPAGSLQRRGGGVKWLLRWCTTAWRRALRAGNDECSRARMVATHHLWPFRCWVAPLRTTQTRGRLIWCVAGRCPMGEWLVYCRRRRQAGRYARCGGWRQEQ